MSTLTKFKDVEVEEAAERAADEQRAKVQAQYHKKEREAIFKEFRGYLMPFNRETIKKHKITVKTNEKKLTLDLFIDGRLYRRFLAETNYHGCNCSECHEGYTGHEGEYSHDIEVYSVNKKGELKDEYFFWYGPNKEYRENHFVKSFKELLEKYDSDIEWKKYNPEDAEEE
jgi:hypothetical protein